MEILLSEILLKIRHQENIFSSHIMQTSDEAYQMTLFLNTMLHNIKADVLKSDIQHRQRSHPYYYIQLCLNHLQFLVIYLDNSLVFYVCYLSYHNKLMLKKFHECNNLVRNKSPSPVV